MRHDGAALGDEAHICELRVAHERAEVAREGGWGHLQVAEARLWIGAAQGVAGANEAQEAVAQQLQARDAEGLPRAGQGS